MVNRLRRSRIQMDGLSYNYKSVYHLKSEGNESAAVNKIKSTGQGEQQA